MASLGQSSDGSNQIPCQKQMAKSGSNLAVRHSERQISVQVMGVEHGGFEPPTPCLPEMWYALRLVLHGHPARCTVGFLFRTDSHTWPAVAGNSGHFSGQQLRATAARRSTGLRGGPPPSVGRLPPLQHEPGIRLLDCGCGHGSLTVGLVEGGARAAGGGGSYSRGRNAYVSGRAGQSIPTWLGLVAWPAVSAVFHQTSSGDSSSAAPRSRQAFIRIGNRHTTVVSGLPAGSKQYLFFGIAAPIGPQPAPIAYLRC